jgi:hypothetical protein
MEPERKGSNDPFPNFYLFSASRKILVWSVQCTHLLALIQPELASQNTNMGCLTNHD